MRGQLCLFGPHDGPATTDPPLSSEIVSKQLGEVESRLVLDLLPTGDEVASRLPSHAPVSVNPVKADDVVFGDFAPRRMSGITRTGEPDAPGTSGIGEMLERPSARPRTGASEGGIVEAAPSGHPLTQAEGGDVPIPLPSATVIEVAALPHAGAASGIRFSRAPLFVSRPGVITVEHAVPTATAPFPVSNALVPPPSDDTSRVPPGASADPPSDRSPDLSAEPPVVTLPVLAPQGPVSEAPPVVTPQDPVSDPPPVVTPQDPVEILKLEVAHVAGDEDTAIPLSIAASLADPAAELPVVFMVLDAKFRVASARGERTIDPADFFVTHLTTTIEPDEMLVEIDVPPVAPRTGHAFTEFARRHGDYALAGLAACARADGTNLRNVRLAYFGVGATPVRALHAEAALAGGDIDAAVAALGNDLAPPDDVQESGAVKTHLAGVLLRRVAKQLLGTRS